MKKFLKMLFSVIFVGVLVIPSFGIAAEPIKFGMPNALSGHGASYAQPMVKGAEVALKEINAKGGVLGRPIQLILRDHQGKSELAQRYAEELISSEKVNFLVGTIYSSTAMSISQVAKRHKVFFLDCGVRATAFTEEEGHRYVGSISVDTTYEGRASAQYVADYYKKEDITYWLIGSDYAYGRDAAKYFKEHIKKVKPKSKQIGETWVKMGETEFTTPIGAIAAAKPDVIVSLMITNAFQSFTIQAKPYNLFQRPVIAIPLIGNTENLRPLGKNYPEGVICSSKYVQGLFKYPASKHFEKLYLDTTKETWVPAFAADGYMLMWVMAKAIEKAGTTDTEKVIDALGTLQMDTPKGRLIMRAVDKKCNLGEPWGITKYNQNLGFVELDKVKYIDAAPLMHTPEEVMAVRKK
jgi:branched-chain amino acid transport system substrate-binding protein